MRIGVYVCHCGVNIAASVDVEEVARFAQGLPFVVVSRHYPYMCSEPGQDLIRQDIRELGLDRVVVAACSPRMHEPTFRRLLESEGLNPYLLEMANVREHCSWVHEDREQATRKAKDLVAAAVARCSLLEPLRPQRLAVRPAVLVIGGGIAGIQAALDVAQAGYEVTLVEREPTIGGHMARLDKTFPTLDCAACILTPKMVELAHHPRVRLLTCAEVESVEGVVGDFRVRVRRRARYVDESKCTGCGLCAEACRLRGRIPNEFDLGLGRRGAIYLPFPQAVPGVYVVDRERCYFLRRGFCGRRGEDPPCVRACRAGAIDFSQADSVEEIQVGAIIVATGFEPFDPRLKPELGYGRYPEVITSLELERLLSASGPTGGRVLVQGREPRRVVFVHCVGSRDVQLGNPWCSRVCCMYTAKHAFTLKERIPDAQVTVLYMDVRAFGKGFEEFYDRVREHGVVYRRGNPAEVYRRGDELVVLFEDTLLGEPVELPADLVVLAVGLRPPRELEELARRLKLPRSADGFLAEAHPKLRPVDTVVEGVYLAGCCQGPKDIPDTVAQAKAAASAALILLSQGQVELEPVVAEVDVRRCSGCRECERVCPMGAISFDERRGVVVVEEALCKGCGACAAACRPGAMTLRHFRDEQLLGQLEALSP